MKSSSSLYGILLTVELLFNSMIIAFPIWIFFLQSPLLFTFMGRDKFIPPMMRITKLLFHWTLPICAIAVTVLCIVGRGCSITTTNVITSLVSLTAVLINSIIVVPKALQAGKRATVRNKKDDNTNKSSSSSHKVQDFVIDGGEASGGSKKSGTRVLHQTVVFFVTIMLIGAILHLHVAVNNSEGECSS